MSHKPEIFLECLEAEGFDTIGAENGLVGVQRAQQQLPDLVICDVMMARWLRCLNHAAPRPCDSDYSLHFYHLQGYRGIASPRMDLGADDYLLKPSTAEDYWGDRGRLEKGSHQAVVCR